MLETLIDGTRSSLALVTSIASAIYVITSIYFLRRYKERTREREARTRRSFFSALSKGLEDETIKDLKDVVDIYKGVREIGSEDLTYRPHLSRWLREYLVNLVSGRPERGYLVGRYFYGEEEEPKLSAEEIRKYKELVSSFIGANDSSSPYADLPSAERAIITDISTYAIAGNVDDVVRKLSELASAIQAREDSLVRIQATNRWAVPLAVVGLVLTIAFGTLSLLQ